MSGNNLVVASGGRLECTSSASFGCTLQIAMTGDVTMEATGSIKANNVEVRHRLCVG